MSEQDLRYLFWVAVPIAASERPGGNNKRETAMLNDKSVQSTLLATAVAMALGAGVAFAEEAAKSEEAPAAAAAPQAVAPAYPVRPGISREDRRERMEAMREARDRDRDARRYWDNPWSETRRQAMEERHEALREQAEREREALTAWDDALIGADPYLYGYGAPVYGYPYYGGPWGGYPYYGGPWGGYPYYGGPWGGGPWGGPWGGGPWW